MRQGSRVVVNPLSSTPTFRRSQHIRCPTACVRARQPFAGPAAALPRLVPSPVSHREQPVALADTPQQVGEVDQVLGDQVYYRALALHPALAGQQAG
jgi:hypothetical protein